MNQNAQSTYQNFSPIAYIWAVITGVLTAMFTLLVILVVESGLSEEMSNFGILFAFFLLAMPFSLVIFLPSALLGHRFARQWKIRKHWQMALLGSACSAATTLPMAAVVGFPAGLLFLLFAIIPGALAALVYAKVATWDPTANYGSNKTGYAHE